MKASRNMQRAVFAVPSDISAALDELGIEHRVSGDEATAVCPNPEHDDHSPSWSVNLTDGRHHCFSCGFGGSFTRLVSAVRGVRFDEADLWVRMHRVVHQRPAEEVEVRPAPLVKVSEADLWRFGEPPDEELAKRSVSREAAQQLEILWDARRAAWVFPIRHPATGRLLGWQLKMGKTVRNRPSSVEKHRSLFGQELVMSTGTEGDVIVVESPLNAGRFLTAGYPRVVATYGIEFSDDQIRAAMKLGTGILFAQDNDNAGQQKIARWLHEHPEMRHCCRVFDYGKVYEDKLTHAYVHPKGDKRDPGDLTDDELTRGIEYATSGTRTRFEEFPQWR